MRRKLLFFVPILLLLSCSDNSKLDVISLNIRYDNPADAGNAWSLRKDVVVDFLIDEHPDIFGLQEVLWHQYQYIDSLLPGYKSVSAGRNDGIRSGEMTPLFFNEKRFDLIDHNTFWLSETPDMPGSKGWGAVLPRIVTWARLNDNFTGIPLRVKPMVRPEILAVETGNLAPGHTGTILITFRNTGDATAYGAKVRLTVMEPFTAETSGALLGDIGPGEEGTAPLSLSLARSATIRTYGLTAVLRYYDEAGNLILADPLEVEIHSTSENPVKALVTNPVFIVGALGCLILGLYFFRFRD